MLVSTDPGLGDMVDGDELRKVWWAYPKSHVCVCVILLYSFSSVASGVPYLLHRIEYVVFSSTQLTIIKCPLGLPEGEERNWKRK